MSKQKDRLDLATKYIIDEPDKPTTELDAAERKTIEHLRLIYDYFSTNPLATAKEQRDYIIKTCGVSDITAYRYISMIEMLMGEQSVAGKNFVKLKVKALLEEEYTCLNTKDYEGAKARHKLIQDYIKAYRLNVEEGETLDLVRQLREQEPINITTDISVLGINISEKEQKEIDRIKKKYGYDDDEMSLDKIKTPSQAEINSLLIKYGLEDEVTGGGENDN